MDGEAGWWTTSRNIGLPPLARVMGVGRQQHEKKVKDIIENFWGDLFGLKGNATYGVEKELVDGGMKYGV